MLAVHGASISLEHFYDEIGRNRATPAVTVEALKHAVREHGPKTLAEPTNQERFRRCDVMPLADRRQRRGHIPIQERQLARQGMP